MSDIMLFSLKEKVVEYRPKSIGLEKSLQKIIEANLEKFLGIKFLATEYSTGKEHGGRIDTIGFDENNCPVIIEYKRHTNENVINQGLYYLDWLLDHKAEFELLVLKNFSREIAENIEWNSARVVCIAEDFTKFDQYAVKQINRNIELIRYKLYGENEFLIFELVNSACESKSFNQKEIKENIKESQDSDINDLFDVVKDFVFSLGEDIQEKHLKHYVAFKRFKNFLAVKVTKKELVLWVYSEEIDYEENKFIRSVSNIGHHGTGNTEIRISNEKDFEKAKFYINRSYELN